MKKIDMRIHPKVMTFQDGKYKRGLSLVLNSRIPKNPNITRGINNIRLYLSRVGLLGKSVRKYNKATKGKPQKKYPIQVKKGTIFFIITCLRIWPKILSFN